MYIVSNSIIGNRKFSTLNAMDHSSMAVLAIEVGTWLSSRRVIRKLDCTIKQVGKWVSIRTVNGPEFASKVHEL